MDMTPSAKRRGLKKNKKTGADVPEEKEQMNKNAREVSLQKKEKVKIR